MFSGKNACFMLEVWKGRVLTERHVVSNSVIETNPNFGDGNDHVRNAGEGTLARYFDFYAPSGAVGQIFGNTTRSLIQSEKVNRNFVF